MNPAHWQDLKDLFGLLVEQSAEQRAAFLAHLRADDPKQADELARLLQSHDEKTLAIDRPAFDGHNLLAAESLLLNPGEILMGRFRIVRCIGRGGMGEVYEAQDRHMGRIAIKIIRPEIVRLGNVAARFKAEAIAARSITSPFVCRIHEFLVAPPENGRPELAFLTMEFLDGCTLWDRLKQQGAFSRLEAEHLAVQLCRGLQAIHDAEIVHRDLKARNVMLVQRQSSLCPVIMDFGLARPLLTLTTPGFSFTEIGAVVGTPEYMAPEQFEGRDVTRTADIYALGIVLYELVVGKHPFEAATPLGAAVRRAKRPPSACSLHPEFPRRWDRVIERCLEYDAERRFQSATEVAQALTHRHSDIHSLPHTVAEVSSYKYSLWLALLLVIAGLVGFAVFRLNRPVPPSPEALRWFNEGVHALHDGTYLKATHLLEQSLTYDKDFALAHARLADAWAELDFQGKAEHEMLLAETPEARSGLSRNDELYLNAIRASVTGDFTSAAQHYQRILKALPEAEKSAGSLDLGRVYEKAGDITNALNYYQKAEQAASSAPAPYLRLAVLESRQGDYAAAAKSFAQAKKLYQTRIDDEGLAEVDYQLGFAASLAGNLKEAKEDEEKSLAAAKRINSPQLETRALTRLAVIAYSEDAHDQNGKDECIERATEAMEIARDNNLHYWDVEARIRIGNDYADHLDFTKAESYLQPALREAQEGQLPRLEALAHYGLAILGNLEHRPDQTINHANAALAFYTSRGFFQEALNNDLLLTRAQEQKGNFRESLRDALKQVEIAKRSKNAVFFIRPMKQSVRHIRNCRTIRLPSNPLKRR